MNSQQYESTRSQQRQESYKCNGENESGRLGGSAKQSKALGDESNKISHENSSWRNSLGEEDFSGRQGTTGKVLDELKKLREMHLAFVSSHTKALESQLEKNKGYQCQIEESINRLEKEILGSLDTQE